MSRQRQRPRDVHYVCLLKRFTIPGSEIPQANRAGVLPLSWLTDGAATRRLVDDCRWMNNSNPPNVQVFWTCILKAYCVPEGSTGTRRGPLRCTLTSALPQMWMNGLRWLWLVALVAKCISSYTFNFLLLVITGSSLRSARSNTSRNMSTCTYGTRGPSWKPLRSKKKRSIQPSGACLTHVLVWRCCSFAHSAPSKTTLVETSATNSSPLNYQQKAPGCHASRT